MNVHAHYHAEDYAKQLITSSVFTTTQEKQTEMAGAIVKREADIKDLTKIHLVMIGEEDK